ncbi:MAG: DUF501 domain-containing protein [Firmicutes bacterium]|jgi:hypothetical protein|nr:DUF501 domain-containing protein [Bacillota bacterium]MDH7496338.1 DUF501 domain-containing protein [Bacillota bacterium]
MTDEELVERQMGRKPRGFVRVATRCPLGLPETIVTKPVMLKGDATDRRERVEPFPTVFWLTCPGAVRAVSELEARGWVRRLQERLARDPMAFEAHLDAARSYADYRVSLLSPGEASHLAKEHPRQYKVIACSGVGGVLGRSGDAGVKCLHAHYADYLARGVNPIGKWVRELLTGTARSSSASAFPAPE